MIVGAIILVIINNNALDNDTRLLVYSFFVSLAYSLNGSIYIMLPVQEREEHLKYALNVMGCRVLPYWVATFVFDFSVYIITVIVFLLTIYIGDIKFL